MKPSLSATWKGGQTLFNCFGCNGRKIPSAIGLTFADLLDSPGQRPIRRRAEVVAAYRYESFDGKLLAEKVRLQPKGFFFRRPTSGQLGSFVPGLDGVELPAYRLGDLVDARQVLVVEGEKAVERLREEWFQATCPPSGWRRTDSETLWRCGAHEVVVLPDNDQPGRRKAEKVAQACSDYRPERVDCPADDPWPMPADETRLVVKLVELPDLPIGGDVVDWFGMGHTADDLRKIIARTAIWYSGKREADRLARKRALNTERQRRFRERQRALKTGP